jgi:DNA modification methylase
MFVHKLNNYKFEMISVDMLKPFPKNSRKHSEQQIDQLIKSINEFGFTNPILIDENDMIIAGHCRLIAAKKIHMRIVPCVVLRGLSDAQKRALVIADNKLALNAEWDIDILSHELKLLKDDNFEIGLTGFSAEEIEDITPDCVSVGLTDDDAIPDANDETITKLGDIYTLGNHRLMCGDSTMVDSVDKLMGGNQSQVCFTSPPYNLGNNSKLRSGKDSAYIEKSDHKSQKDYLDFLYGFTNIAITKCDTLFINIQCLAGNKLIFPEYLYNYRSNIIDIMIWDKVNAAPAMANKVLNSVFEFIIIISNKINPSRAINTSPDFRGTINNIYRLTTQGKKEKIQKDHGAVFPVQFAEDHINNFSTGDVYDPFGGSGSTLIACEKTNRKCFMMELSPQYCDIIVKRWEQFTGKKAVLNA